VYLDITSPEKRKLQVAVPYVLDKDKPREIQETGKKMAELLGKALAFHGFAEIIDPDLYGGSQDANWGSINAEFVILGQYQTGFRGIVLELRLVDVQEGRMIFGRRYRGPFAKHKRMLLKFIDDVVQELTGERGVSLTKIAFVSDQTGDKEIFLADVLGNEVVQVTRHRYLAVSPRISPKGDLLAYTSYHRGNPNLYLTRLAELKTTRAISRRPGLNMAPAWSPDGKRMILTLSKDGNPDLYLMDLKGKIIRRLTHGEGVNVSPTWSPDGKRIAFVSDRSGTPQIYVMALKSKRVQRITYQGSENTEPAWSPKGDWIAYTGRTDSTHHIFLIRPDGGAPVQVTRYWGDHESPSWSPDGRQLVFSRKRNDRQQLCTIFIDGTGLRVLFPELPGNQTSPQWSPRLPM